MTKPYAVGIDLGGTNIKGGLVRPDGSVVLSKSIKTEPEGGTAHVVERIASVANGLLAEAKVQPADVAGVCVGSPGPLDSRKGFIYEAPNLRWKDVHLSALLAPLVGVPVFVENDANVAAYGEAWAGAARNSRCALMLTLGTGVGGGIVIDGEVWRGVTDTGAELGHMTINYGGPKCACGSTGCIEMYASATAVARRMKEAVLAGRKSSLSAAVRAGEEIDSKRIHEAALAGDPLAREILAETGRFLGIAIASYVNIFNPDYVILHGGLVNAGELLLGPMRDAMKARCFHASQRGLQVLPSALKGDAGIVGAAGIAFRRAGNA